jgi:hypothetical protein
VDYFRLNCTGVAAKGGNVTGVAEPAEIPHLGSAFFVGRGRSPSVRGETDGPHFSPGRKAMRLPSETQQTPKMAVPRGQSI